MANLGDGPQREPRGDAPFSYMRRRRRSRVPVLWGLGVAALLLLLGGAAWYWLRSPEPDAPPVAERPDEPVDPSWEAPDRDVPPLDLPELDESDAFVRDVVAGLSAHPELARWLVTDDLVYRFVRTVVHLAGGTSPAEPLEFMEPAEAFRAQEAAGRTVIGPESHRRYTLVAETFASLHTEGSAVLYQQLHPLLVEAHEELGLVQYSFDETVAMAAANLLEAEVPSEPVEVVRVEGFWEFRDPALEEATAAEKHLIRMGPENARRVQGKLAELVEEIGIRPIPDEG